MTNVITRQVLSLFNCLWALAIFDEEKLFENITVFDHYSKVESFILFPIQIEYILNSGIVLKNIKDGWIMSNNANFDMIL